MPHSSRVLCGLRVSANNFFLHPPWTDFAIPDSHVVKARQGVTGSSRMSVQKRTVRFRFQFYTDLKGIEYAEGDEHPGLGSIWVA